MKNIFLAVAVVALASAAQANFDGASNNSAASWNASATQPSAASNAKMAPVGQFSAVSSQAPGKFSTEVQVAGAAATKDMSAIMLSENKNKMQPSVQNSTQVNAEYSQKMNAIYTNFGKRIDWAVLDNTGKSVLGSLASSGEVVLSSANAVTSQEKAANAAAMRVQLNSEAAAAAFQKAFNGSVNNVSVTVSASGEVLLASGVYLGKLILATGQEVAFIASQTGQIISVGAQFSGVVISAAGEGAWAVTKAAASATVASVEGSAMYLLTSIKNTPAAIGAGSSAAVNTLDGLADGSLTASVMLVSKAPSAASNAKDLSGASVASADVLLNIPAAVVDAVYHEGHQYKKQMP